MRGIDGQYAIEVIAKGMDLGLDSSNVTSFQIINNIHQHLPTISFAFKDASGAALDNLITDGDPIVASIGLPNNLYKGLAFKAMGQPSIQVGATYNQISVQGVLDKIGWMKKVVDKNYKGNSSDVISQLAGEVGLIPDVDSTNDTMNWLPNRTNLVQFARHVAERSFSSATSAMLMATTDTGKLRFKDLDKLISEGSKAILGTGGIPVWDYSVTPKSLVANAARGYGSTSIGSNEDGSIFEGNKILMTMMSGANSISAAFQEAIGELGSRITSLSPLAGNTHEKWNQALHQNPRIKASYAFDISVLTRDPTFLELLDTVDFRPMNYATNKEAKSLTGKYIVTATTKTMVNNRYFEKIVLTSQGAGGV